MDKGELMNLIDGHANVVEADGAIDIETPVGGICKLSKVWWCFALIFVLSDQGCKEEERE
jgi:hypothetical protein